jgi:glycosyltransferase involved in cell wall biosynthesis
MNPNNDILFSIIVPIYNAELYIGRSIESVIKQTYTNWELVLVDDCSTDGTRKIIDWYVQTYPNIKYISLSQNSGNAKIPRDTGVAFANGDYCVMFDSDDELSIDYLQNAYEAIVNQEADVVISRLHMRNIATRELTNTLPNAESFLMPSSGKDACELILSSWKFSGGGIIFRKVLYEYVIKLNPQNYMYSDEMSERILVYYANKVVLSNGVYTYWQHSESITHKFSYKLFDMLDVDLQLMDFTQQRYNVNVVNTVCISVFGRLIALYKLLLRNKEQCSVSEYKRIEDKFHKVYDRLADFDWKKYAIKYRIYMSHFNVFNMVCRIMFTVKK